jgi:hypothetical protein
MDKMMFDVIGSIYLLLGWHLMLFFSRLLPIAVVGLKHSIIHWNPEFEAILLSPTVLNTVQLHWSSAGQAVSLIVRLYFK